MKYASRVADLHQEGAYAVLSRAASLEAAGREIIHLEIGQPDFPTFPHISQAGIEAIAHGRTGYNPPAGITWLREAIAADAGSRRGMDISPRQVEVCPGAKPGLFFTAMSLIEPGDEVIYPDPGFPTYPAMIAVCGGKPVPVQLREEHDFSFDLDCFDDLVSERTRLVIINSPANPTGGVMSIADLQHIARSALRHGFWVLSDEIYSRMVYDQPRNAIFPSISALPGMAERTVIVDGFSKTYAMTGWRLGYAIMPESLAERFELLLTHSVGCTATFTQDAGVEALVSSQEMIEQMVEQYRRRRDRLVSGLNSIPGVTCRLPQGAIYAFPNVKAFGLPASELAGRLLEEAGVAVLAGTDFGVYGEGYLRLCYATSTENLHRAIELMGDLLAGLKP